MSSWAILKRSFISQGRKELLTPPLTPHLRGHSASLRDGLPVFCLRRLAHLTTCGGFIAWLSWLLSNCLRILSRNASQWEQVNLSTGLIHQTAKTWGVVNTKCIVNMQIIFQTQVPLYKLDTSIICCNVIVSTWDVSRKQIGDMADLVGRRHGRWEGTNGESPIHQIGNCFVWKWRPKRNQNIIIFPKKCVYKLKKYKLGKKEQVFEKLCRHRPQTYPNIPKQLVAPGREGCGDPRPCTSRERLVTIPNVPMVAPGVFYLSGSQWQQNANLQLVEIVQAKKRNSCYDHDLDTSAISRGKL